MKCEVVLEPSSPTKSNQSSFTVENHTEVVADKKLVDGVCFDTGVASFAQILKGGLSITIW